MSYLQMLRMPHFLRVLSGSWMGRLPMAMAAVSIPLSLREAGADYAFVGTAAACFAIASALGAPALGRLVDRVGQTLVLAPTALLAAAGFIMIAVAPAQHSTVLTGAVLAGLFTPPLEPCLRVLWPDIADKKQLDSVYAVDSAAQEMVFVAGPLLVSLCLAIATPVTSLWLQAGLCLAGVLVFATAAPSRRWRPTAHDRHWLGPLRKPGLIIALVAPAGAGMAIGTLNVLVVSYAERHEIFGGAPMLLTVHSLASLVSVLAYGAVTWKMETRKRLLFSSGGLLLGYALLTLVPPPVPMFGIMVVAGVFLAPTLVSVFKLIGELAPTGTATEAFAWLVTLFAAGNSLGAAIVGMVLHNGNMHLAAACGAFGALGCLVLLASGYRLLATPAKELSTASH
uniref:MFS transporter n=2 Tax=Streptomyces candidus TaxID=67283 RepID=A0A5J6DF15_9ACTN|nr:MFS transporter [Streptomyces candidus]QER91013.1 MFS transporter [Streptomyces candidus]